MTPLRKAGAPGSQTAQGQESRWEEFGLNLVGRRKPSNVLIREVA